MSCHAVHQKLHALGEASVPQLAEAAGITQRAARNRLAKLVRRGLVARTARGVKGQPIVYSSAVRPQATDPGLSDALADIVSDRRTMRSLIADLGGVAWSSVNQALLNGTLDTPDTANRVFDRQLAAGAARRLAELLDDRAARLREWADRCDRARWGEG